MEFPFDLHIVLPHEITKVSNKLCPFRKNAVESLTELQGKLSRVVDVLGLASSRAQGLNSAITTAAKLRASDHHLYIYKETKEEEQKSFVVGILRVGIKKLFVTGLHGEQLEVHPLCVLDFYVHENFQRSGYGKRLFDHMLQVESIKPEHMAIDRPSSKFLNFLKKHYLLKNAFPQVNKFVVFDHFFRDLSAVGYVPSGRRYVTSAPTIGRAIRITYAGTRPSSVLPYDDHTLSLVKTNTRIAHDKGLENGSSLLLPGAVVDTSRVPKMPSFGKTKEGGGIFGSQRGSGKAERCQSTRQVPAYSRHTYQSSAQSQANVAEHASRRLTPLGQEGEKSRPLGSLLPALFPTQGHNKRDLSAESDDNPLALRLRCNNASPATPSVAVSRENVENKHPHRGSSTSDGIMRQGDNRSSPSLGTSWNIFGIPSGQTWGSKNIYAGMQRRGLQR